MAPLDQKNSLDVQREYFRAVVRDVPEEETARLALSLVLHELGEEEESERCFAEGISHLDRLWLPKLIPFVLASGVLAGALWYFGVRWPWVTIPVTAIGPVLWLIIRQNRHKHMPQVARWQRDEVVKTCDLRQELERAERIKSQRQTQAGNATHS